jgi:hypothetical protein
VLYKQSFKVEYDALPSPIRCLFDAKDRQFQDRELTLLQQGWMHYVVINDAYVAFGMYPRTQDEFLWLSIRPVEKLPVIF